MINPVIAFDDLLDCSEFNVLVCSKIRRVKVIELDYEDRTVMVEFTDQMGFRIWAHIPYHFVNWHNCEVVH